VLQLSPDVDGQLPILH